MAFGDETREFLERKKAGMFMLLQNMAGHAESDMKQSAPWTDRTSNARNGLNAGVEVGQDRYTFYLAHGMQYGIWLELAHGGNYAVVRPTADQYRTRVSKEVREWWESV